MSGLGWNFGNMSLFPDGQMTIDSNSSPMTKKAVEEIKTKFPKGDCLTLDVSIKNAQGLIPAIFLEKAGGHYKIEPIQIRTYQDVLKNNQAYEDRTEFNNKKCRDEFEKIRIQDMDSTLTKGASKQELSILNPNFKEQYIYIGIGAVVLLLGLYVVTKK